MKWIVYVTALMMLISIVFAADVCVVVDYGNGDVGSECVDVTDGASGYEVLEATNFNLLWSPDTAFGRMICKIEGVGTDVSGQYCYWDTVEQKYWNFDMPSGSEWEHMSVGLSDFETSDGDYLGLTYGTGLAHPNVLSVKKIEVKVDGDKDSGADEDGGKVDHIKPGSKVEFEITVENLYDRDVDVNMEATATVTVDSIDDGDEIEEESDTEEIDSGKDKKIKVKISVPLAVEEDDFDTSVLIQAEDDLGITYEKTIEFTLSVEKEKHEVIISKAEVLPSSVSCGKSAELTYTVTNMGTEDEDVVVSVISSELGLSVRKEAELSEDPFDSENKLSGKVIVSVTEDIIPATYPIRVNAEYNSGASVAEQIAELTVSKCEVAVEENNKVEEEVSQVPVVSEAPTVQNLVPVTQSEPGPIITAQPVLANTGVKVPMAVIVAIVVGFLSLAGFGVFVIVKLL